MKHKTTPRTLFVTASEDSKQAEDLLRSKAIAFSCARVERASSVGYVSESDLPLLITGEGQWEGLTAIIRYIKDQDREGSRI
jgi:hypothetical protein